MNFFERQNRSRKQSARLVLLFGLAVLAIVLAVNVIILATAGPRIELLAMATLGTLGVIGISSLIKISLLRSGGREVAREMGAVAVPEDTPDFHLRRLRNVVEEIAIASGVPMPDIYLMEGEPGINAFAAGYSPSDAAICVTRGALEKLNRDELQGVIAHEFSHILNGDMRLNIRLMGLLFGILVLAIIGRRVLIHGRGVRSKDGAPVFAIALALMVLGYAGVFFGRLIKAGVSRQREYLADASAVQFTRQTSGIAGALKKIAGIQEGSKLQATDGEEVSHMLFGDGVGYSSLFATHPPLLERIKALDPSFRPEDVTALRQQYAVSPPSGLDEDLAMGFSADGRSAMPAAGNEVSIAAERVADQVAEPASDDFQRAGGILAALPAPLRRAAESRELAMPLVMSLLLDGDDGIRQKQLAAIADALGPRESERTAAMFGDLPGLHPMQRMPLAALAFPRLRREPRPTLLRFISVMDTLAHADGEVQPFEYCLSKLLQTQVWEALDPSRRQPRGSERLHALQHHAAALLAVLAKVGHTDDTQAQRAFSAAWEHLFPGSAERYAPPVEWRHALDEALHRLDRLQPSPKQLLIESMTVAISQDGRVSVAEAELLRTTCACLHCPLPPMLES